MARNAPSAIKQPFKLFGADKPEIVSKSFMGSAPTKGHPIEMEIIFYLFCVMDGWQG
jgi:hypothetical protein